MFSYNEEDKKKTTKWNAQNVFIFTWIFLSNLVKLFAEKNLHLWLVLLLVGDWGIQNNE